MPILANQRHELFAQRLAVGLSASDAYVAAGYKRDDGNAARLTGNDKVRTRVAELQARAAEGVVISRQRVLEELAAIAFAPIGTENIRTADKRSALNDIAVMEGWRVDRTEVGQPGDFASMDDATLEAEIARLSGQRLQQIAVAAPKRGKAH